MAQIGVDQRSRRIRRAIVAGSILCAFVLLGLGLALEYRPSWYVPAILEDSEVQATRRDALRLVDHISDQLVNKNSFGVVIPAGQVNTWLAGLSRIWPDAAGRIPPIIQQPMVTFEPTILRAAARVESDGWRAVLSSEYQVELSEDRDHLVVRLKNVYCGAVPIPRAVVNRIVSPMRKMRSVSGEAEDWEDVLRGSPIDQWYAGLSIPNRFIWPNGRRPLRIAAISLEPGLVRLRLEPL